MLGLLIHPRHIVLFDEPEAFLHPPQARRLAEVAVSETPSNCQIVAATHSDEFLRAMLDASEERVIVARLTRALSITV
jgi:predicted ATP-dependent endonuclease of OLD family